MAIVMIMTWPGVGAAQYDALRRRVNWEGEPPAGGMFHVAAASEEGMKITDVWESAEAFQAFTEDRLMPGVRDLGIASEPRIEILPAHAVFAPAYA